MINPPLDGEDKIEGTWVNLKAFSHRQTPSRLPGTARPKVVARGKSSELKSAAVNIKSQMAALNSEVSGKKGNYLGTFEDLLSHKHHSDLRE